MKKLMAFCLLIIFVLPCIFLSSCDKGKKTPVTRAITVRIINNTKKDAFKIWIGHNEGAGQIIEAGKTFAATVTVKGSLGNDPYVMTIGDNVFMNARKKKQDKNGISFEGTNSSKPALNMRYQPVIGYEYNGSGFRWIDLSADPQNVTYRNEEEQKVAHYLATKALTDLDNWQKSKLFGGYITLFDLQKYISVLGHVTFKHDKTQANEGSFNAGAVNMVKFNILDSDDIARLNEKDYSTFCVLTWHELSHAVEWMNWDTYDKNGITVPFVNPKERTTLYGDRNLEFMQTVLKNVMQNGLPVLEKSIVNDNTDKVRQRFSAIAKQYQTALNNLAETKEFPPNLPRLKAWFGFDVDMNALAEGYKDIGSAKKPPFKDKADNVKASLADKYKKAFVAYFPIDLNGKWEETEGYFKGSVWEFAQTNGFVTNVKIEGKGAGGETITRKDIAPGAWYNVIVQKQMNFNLLQTTKVNGWSGKGTVSILFEEENTNIAKVEWKKYDKNYNLSPMTDTDGNAIISKLERRK